MNKLKYIISITVVFLSLLNFGCSTEEDSEVIPVVPIDFGFTESASSAIEGATGSILISLSAPLLEPLSFVLVLSGDATEGTDYILPDGKNILVEAGSSSIEIRYELIDDDVEEKDEIWTIGIGNIQGEDVFNFGQITFSFTIIDNDVISGTYQVIESSYFRKGVEAGSNSDWSGQERIIGFVDSNTFSYNDFWGPFDWTDNSFNFSIDFIDNSITVPIVVDFLYSGDRALNCTDEPEMFNNVPCTGSNIYIPDLVNGKHRILLTYGYFTDSGDANEGIREFYELLERTGD